MGLFSLIKGVVRGARGLGKKAVKGLKGLGEKVVKGVKSGYQKVKQMLSGKPTQAEPKLSDTLRTKGAFKPQGKPKVPYEPPIKYTRTRGLIDKGRALNDPIV